MSWAWERGGVFFGLLALPCGSILSGGVGGVDLQTILELSEFVTAKGEFPFPVSYTREWKLFSVTNERIFLPKILPANSKEICQSSS